jgi:hypothetical protein
MQHTGQIAETTGELTKGHDTHARLVADQDQATRSPLDRGEQLLDPRIDLGIDLIGNTRSVRFDEPIRQPERQTIDQDAAVRCALACQHLGQRKGLLDQAPIGGPPLPMSGDATSHLGIARNCGRHIDNREASLQGQTLGQSTLTGADTPQDQGPRRAPVPQRSGIPTQSSTPFWAMMPASNACLIGRISVTVSAISINSAGAARPVTTACW